MIMPKSVVRREITPKRGEFLDMILRSSDEAKICLNCDLPECKNTGPCKRFKEEKRKLKEET